jgi:hypothetical protein
VDFVATSTVTNLSFAFRDAPAFLLLDNVQLTTGGGPNLVTNGDFEAGPLGSPAPAGWTYLNVFGADFGGFVASSCGTGGADNCYFDGAVQAYDAISPTTPSRRRSPPRSARSTRSPSRSARPAAKRPSRP